MGHSEKFYVFKALTNEQKANAKFREVTKFVPDKIFCLRK